MLKTLTFSSILLALVAVPTASADGCTDLAGNGSLCTYEATAATGTCENGNQYAFTVVSLFSDPAFAIVSGSSTCSGYPGAYSYERNSVYAIACTDATGCAGVSHSWYEYTTGASTFSDCDTLVFSQPTGAIAVGCPVGPLPNPGWGNVLP